MTYSQLDDDLFDGSPSYGKDNEILLSNELEFNTCYFMLCTYLHEHCSYCVHMQRNTTTFGFCSNSSLSNYGIRDWRCRSLKSNMWRWNYWPISQYHLGMHSKPYVLQHPWIESMWDSLYVKFVKKTIFMKKNWN